VSDFDVDNGTIEKSAFRSSSSQGVCPLGQRCCGTAIVLDVATRRGHLQVPTPRLFWHMQAAGRYSIVRAGSMLTGVLRRAKLKPAPGRSGPRIHDLRHAFVVNRMLSWYREGINPQAHLSLPGYLLATGIQLDPGVSHDHRRTASEASERFRRAWSPGTAGLAGTGKRMKTIPFPQLLHAFFSRLVVQQRNVSHHTVCSYRDSWAAILRFVAARKGHIRCPAWSERLSEGPCARVSSMTSSRFVTPRLALVTADWPHYTVFQLRCRSRTVGRGQCASVLRIPKQEDVQAGSQRTRRG